MRSSISSTKQSSGHWLQRLAYRMFEPVHGGSLAAFRIVFGLIMLWEVYRYFDRGWIERYWVRPSFHFTYEFFGWVSPLSADGMTLLFYAMGIASLMVLLGLFYRISITALFVMFTYTFLLEQARYLNHFYLVILINFLMIWIPAHRTWSLDSLLFKKQKGKSAHRWMVWLLQFQIGIVYFFGGLAKLNSDWLTASPMDSWLPKRGDYPLLGDWFQLPETALFFSYSGLMIDLFAWPLLMIRKTRPIAMIALIGFHWMNDWIFTIGIFPWFMIGALTIFLAPSWPIDLRRDLLSASRQERRLMIAGALLFAVAGTMFHGGFGVIAVIFSAGIGAVWFWDLSSLMHSDRSDRAQRILDPKPIYRPIKPLILISMLSWVSIQLLLPLRHLAIDGNPSWTEEGHRFSWHMKLRSKSCTETIYIEHAQTRDKVALQGMPFLESWQRRKVSSRPQLLAQYASFLSDMHDGRPVYASVRCSLNGGAEQALIDSTVNLAAVTFRDWQANEWILR